MRGLLNSTALRTTLLQAIALSLLISLPTVAAESWVEVSPAGTDRVLVDQNSIQRTDNEVRYWEYRDVRQAYSASPAGQPYGIMLYRSVNCKSRQGQVQRLVLFNQNREVIRRISYESKSSPQPMLGTSTEATMRYVCDNR